MWARGYVGIRYREWIEEMARRDEEQGGASRRAAGNLTLGYVTTDVRFSSQPRFVSIYSYAAISSPARVLATTRRTRRSRSTRSPTSSRPLHPPLRTIRRSTSFSSTLSRHSSSASSTRCRQTRCIPPRTSPSTPTYWQVRRLVFMRSRSGTECRYRLIIIQKIHTSNPVSRLHCYYNVTIVRRRNAVSKSPTLAGNPHFD